MPHHGLGGPLRTNTGVLPAHKIQVARPQQMVIAVLVGKRQHHHPQGLAHLAIARSQFGRAQPFGELWQHAAFRHQTGHGPRPARPGIQQRGQRRVFIAEERHPHFIRRACGQAQFVPVGIPFEICPTLRVIGFDQHAARFRQKSGKEEMLGQRQPGVGGRQTVVCHHPGLGAEVFQIEPDRRRRLPRHCGEIGFGQCAAKGLDHPTRRLDRHKRFAPGADRHRLALLHASVRVHSGPEAAERLQVIDPEPHTDVMLARQRARQTPGHANIAIVVDDVTEDVPVCSHGAHPTSGVRRFSTTVFAEALVLYRDMLVKTPARM